MCFLWAVCKNSWIWFLAFITTQSPQRRIRRWGGLRRYKDICLGLHHAAHKCLQTGDYQDYTRLRIKNGQQKSHTMRLQNLIWAVVGHCHQAPHLSSMDWNFCSEWRQVVRLLNRLRKRLPPSPSRFGGEPPGRIVTVGIPILCNGRMICSSQDHRISRSIFQPRCSTYILYGMFRKFCGTFRQSSLSLVEVPFPVVQFSLLDFQA